MPGVPLGKRLKRRLSRGRYAIRQGLRWSRFFSVIVGRARGIPDRCRALQYCLHAAAAAVGICRKPREYRLRLDGAVFNVDAARRDIGPYASVWIDRDYELDDRFVPGENGIVLDVGAQIGFFSMLMARTSPRARIYAVDPDPLSFERLTRNLRDNGCSTVTPFRLAMGSEPGELHFECGYPSSESRVVRQASPTSIRVPCTTLDEFVQDQRLDCIDLLKIDTEGMEVEIIRGARQHALPRVKSAVIEIHHPAYVEPIETALAEAGLQRVFVRTHLNIYFYARAAGGPARPTT